MNVIKVKLRLCESSVKSLKMLLVDVTLSGTNILRDVINNNFIRQFFYQLFPHKEVISQLNIGNIFIQLF